MSEQKLGRPRPQAICDDGEDDVVLSILDAATNDLALLINRLDLEATPASTNNTPLRLSPVQAGEESPLKSRRAYNGNPLKDQLRESTASIASHRPYAKSQSSAVPPVLTAKPSVQTSKPATFVGQQIAPWSELAIDWKVSPRKPLVKPKAALHLKHKRTLTPSPADPLPVFQSLRPANVKGPVATVSSSSLRTLTPTAGTSENAEPSSNTFGNKPSKVGLDMEKLESSSVAPSPTPVFSRVGGHHRKSSSLIPMNSKCSVGSLRRMGVPFSAEARKGLGLCGTLGGSTEPEVDPEDPDSDIPDELQVIVSGHSDDDMTQPLDDTLSFKAPPSPGSPPNAALPVSEQAAEDAEIDDGEGGHGSGSEADTKKSFDFTGELQKLNESGGSDRASFVEQLENAFKTPARIELGFDFGIEEGMLAPPVPALPKNLRPTPPAEDIPRSFSNLGDTSMFTEEDDHEGGRRDSGLTQEHDISFMMRELEDDFRVYPELNRSSSMHSKPSDGRLNRDFKFGGKPSPQSLTNDSSVKPLTLSDIIPPLSHSRSRSMGSRTEDDSVLKSILAKAADVLPMDSDKRSQHGSHRRSPTEVSFPEVLNPKGPAHSRTESGLSFTGFDSFDEVRRGFEFGPNRPAFWPPQEAVFRPAHKQHESLYSIASISSYGAVVNPGAQDPFGYAHEPSRPPSMDDMSLYMSMSMSVDDTFSFINRNKPRKRVDSDSSSFYFRAPGGAQMIHPYRRGHRRGPSAMSVASNAPPVSLYNRSFAGHRRNHSNTSASSVALSYAMHGAAGRSAWAQHNRDFSVDSIMSDYSERHIARPGLGDKMFETSHGAPLSVISASPESTYSDPEVNRTSWDSIMDNDRYTSVVDDSLFDKTRNRNSVSSESVFGFDPYAQYTRPPPSHQFRPLSIMSEMSVHSSPKEDDTMITMLGGGHVRRRSVSSLVEASPCVQVERNKRTALPGRVLQFDMEPPAPAKESPNKSRLVEKPSIASTSSYQFGGERMIKARQGLFERQSLEDSALIAHGEDLLASYPSSANLLPLHGRVRAPATPAPPVRILPRSRPPLRRHISGGSQSSIDLGHLNTVLSKVTQPTRGDAGARTRARARGIAHRRRIEQARMSRSSVYETIQEEASVLYSSPSPKHPTPHSVAKQAASPLVNNSVYIVDGDSESIYSDWDEERGIMTLRHYYALRDEAHETVAESRCIWVDTPFSVFAVQSFQPPKEPAVMQAMLEHL
ncbi:hypothetical protein C8Q70DRAFT_1059376 [Cubamyces menziesii]|nr:hypothetical protein C8Q70DRAFT_1059376 [Cubamyces menziesii]